jgi:hypothetical protein
MPRNQIAYAFGKADVVVLEMGSLIGIHDHLRYNKMFCVWRCMHLAKLH